MRAETEYWWMMLMEVMGGGWMLKLLPCLLSFSALTSAQNDSCTVCQCEVIGVRGNLIDRVVCLSNPWTKLIDRPYDLLITATYLRV